MAQIIHGPYAGQRIDFEFKETLKRTITQKGLEYLGFGVEVHLIGTEWKYEEYQYFHFWRKR